MKNLTKFLLGTLMVVSATAHSAPNVWQSGFAMGTMEYSISNSKGQMIVVACAEGAGEDIDHSFDYYPNGFNGEPKKLKNVSVKLDDKKVVYPPTEDGLPTSTRGGANQWVDFTAGISKARKIDVYSNNKLIATFKPSLASIKAEASDLAKCEPKW